MMRVLLWFLTLVRVALIPAFVYFAAEAQALGRSGLDPAWPRNVAWLTLAVMGGSDVLDGWLARRFDLVSQLGAMMDAVADKLVQFSLTAFFALSVGPVFETLPIWFLVLVFGRDIVLGVGVSMLRARYGKIKVVHRWHGRLASILVFVVLAWLALGLSGIVLAPLLWATAAITVFSAYEYSMNGIRQGRALAAARTVL